MAKTLRKIVVSRTDSIGDVMLTLPSLGILRRHYPEAQLIFLGSAYTQAVVAKCKHADEFWDWQQVTLEQLGTADVMLHVFPRKELAKMARAAQIPLRIGTSHRIFHWGSCNKLVNLGRKNSQLHEAQLNVKLMEPLLPETDFGLNELPEFYGWQIGQDAEFPLTEKFNLILHAKSKGSAKEWGMERFLALAKRLSPERFQLFVSGTEAEGAMIRKACPEIFELPHITDITGQFSLSAFIDFIGHADGLLACSTGPLHLAAASGIRCLGLYPANRPMHAGRWAPIGKKAQVLSEASPNPKGQMLDQIRVEAVAEVIESWLEDHGS